MKTVNRHFTERVEHQKMSVLLELYRWKGDLNNSMKEVICSISYLFTFIIFKLLFMQVKSLLRDLETNNLNIACIKVG